MYARHERCATFDLRRDGEFEGDRHRPRCRRLATPLRDGLEARGPHRGSGIVSTDHLHRHLLHRRVSGAVWAVQVLDFLA